MTWGRRASEFLFHPDSDRWLTSLRVGLGLTLIFYAVSLQADWTYLFGDENAGLINRRAFEFLLSLQSPVIPQLGWLVWIGGRLGLSESFSLSFAWMLLLTAGCFLFIGLLSRPAAITAWFLQLSASKSGGLLSYGADNLITIGLFYLMIAPLPDRWSLDIRLQRPRAADPSLSGLHRRVLQFHLCLIYFFSGLTKCLGKGWWDGSNIWRALTIPPFNVLSMSMVASWKPILPLLGLSVCLIEISYAVLIWPRWSRQPVLYLVCVMHCMVGIAMGMYLFGLVMVVLNLAAFATWDTQPANA